MQLAKSIIPKIFKQLYRFFFTRKRRCCQAIIVIFLLSSSVISAQDNSPYSRFGIGDLAPGTNIISTGMGGISAGYTDYLSINFRNPASYAYFQAVKEQKSNKLLMGRAILDLGINVGTRTLEEPKTNKKFSSTNAMFSYVQVGVPLKNNWGLSFGLRPVSRIDYNIIRSERLKDPVTGVKIDSSVTLYTGQGGAYQVSVGSGIYLFNKERANGMSEKLGVGVNANYLFGSKDYSTRRSLINDTVNYYQANYETKTNFGGIVLDAGIQYTRPLNTGKNISLTVGAYGTWGQNVNSRQDILRETFLYDANLGNVRLDSISDTKDVKGKIELPTSYTVGFLIQKPVVINKESGWMFGVDFSQQNWDKYRFYGQKDSVQNSWTVRAGGQFNPTPKRNYFSNVSYRFGFFMGPDYIKVGKKMDNIGGSFGLGLPIAISRQAPNQITLINLAFEYGKRGNTDNLLHESLFRFSVGFSLSDMWFVKRKYD